MAKKTIIITGDKKLNKKLKRLTSKEQKTVFRNAARPAIKPLHQEIKSNAGDNKQTGQLQKSYKIRSLARSRSRVGIRVTTENKSFNGNFYASFQELGWKAGNARRQVEPQHDMKRAAESKRAAVLRDFRQRLKSGILATAKK